MPTPVPQGVESDWTPSFPGLMDAENCGEWDTGIPIEHKIRPKDEDYWDKYRGAPKAFLSLGVAQEMWGNRWGNHTGLRVNGNEEAEDMKRKLTLVLSPFSSGLRLIGLKDKSSLATSGTVDFSQLFMAFGLFVILAGLSFSALLFSFSLEQRNEQVGLFTHWGMRACG